MLLPSLNRSLNVAEKVRNSARVRPETRDSVFYFLLLTLIRGPSFCRDTRAAIVCPKRLSDEIHCQDHRKETSTKCEHHVQGIIFIRL